MNLLAKKKNIIKTSLHVFLSAAAFILLSIPAFSMTGFFLKPIVICFTGSVLIGLIFSLLKAEKAVGTGQIIFVVFWIIVALVKEFEIQRLYGPFSYWVEFFYFDKLLVIGTIWLGTSLVFACKRIFHRCDNTSFDKFFNHSSIAFVVFYAALLIYSFVLIRLQTGEYPLYLIPIRTVREYIEQFSYTPYEVLMMVFGNLFYFTPMGYIFSLLLREKKKRIKIPVLLFFPIVAFSMLEISQYIFQNGFCEFDDIAMNTLGFWFGAILCPLTDCIAKRISKNKIQQFWK